MLPEATTGGLKNTSMSETRVVVSREFITVSGEAGIVMRTTTVRGAADAVVDRGTGETTANGSDR